MPRTASPRTFLSPPTHRSTSFTTPSSPTTASHPSHGLGADLHAHTRQRRRPSASSSVPSISVYTEDGDGDSHTRRDSMSAYSDEWDEEYEGEGEDEGAPRRPRAKRDEPMSPLAVVLYVVFFYIIWQILTRSDHEEILAHLPPSSPLHGPYSVEQQQAHPYHLPYHLPHLPSPIPSSLSAPDTSTSTWRVVLGTLVYPIYLLITLAAIPVPFLMNGLHLVFSLLATILSPVTSTTRLLARTFLVAPLGLVRNALASLYPIYVFVGGVVGVGCVMGLGAGWVGQISLDFLLGGKRRRKSTRSRSRSKKHRDSSSHHRGTSQQPAVHVHLHEPVPVKIHRAADLEAMVTPIKTKSRSPKLPATGTHGSGGSSSYSQRRRVNSSDSSSTEVPYTPTTPAHAHFLDSRRTPDKDRAAAGAGAGSAREPLVLGIRRRGVRS